MNQAVVNLREGVRRGYSLPRPLVEKSLRSSRHSARTRRPTCSTSPCAEAQRHGHRRASPSERSDDRRDQRPHPASYRALHDFLQREYLPRARTSVALSALPLGESWYAYLAKRFTDGTLGPAQLHAAGTAEVERARQRLTALLAETAFAGNAPGFMDHMRHDPRFSFNGARS